MGILRKNWKRTLALALVALLCVVLYATHQNKNTIVLRDDGFHPRTLTIRAGETVTFTSERGKYFWPASDFHPTHLLYPKFDAKKPVAPRASWSFTFDTPGTYKFHDHLAAFYFGIVRVTDANGSAPDDCMNHGGQLACWQDQIFIVLAEKGLNAAYDVVARLYRTEPAFSASCHYIAHNIGLASYQFYLKDPTSIISPQAVVCASGFYHGFMEGYLGATGDVKGAAAVCDDVGEAIGKESPDARLQCFHGIGHGAIETVVANTGVFSNVDDMVGQALSICEQSSAGKDERYRCVSGLYNGIANLFINKEYNLSIQNTDPLALCSRQKTAYKEACYGNMNSLALWAAKNDFSKAAAYILTIPDITYRAQAIVYLSNLNAVTHVADASFKSIVDGCEALPAYRTDCISGFVQGLLEHGSPGVEYVQAVSFCKTSAMNAAEHNACFSTALGNLQGWYSEAKSKEICASVEPELRHYCEQ